MGRAARAKGSRLALAAALLLAAASAVQAQEVRLMPGSSGCVQLIPSAPTNLRAAPGDGQVLLTWDRPANGACVSVYEVTATPVGATRSFGPAAPTQTPEFRLEISQLQNGVEYVFRVQAVSPVFGPGGEASVVTTPRANPPPSPSPSPSPVWPGWPGDATLCSRLLPPSAPTDLKANPSWRAIRLCWKPPANFGCVDEYRVTARRPAAQRSFGAAPLLWSVNKGGCLDLTNLDSGADYIIAVESWSQTFGSGGSASIQATAN
ncbi:hypothetical protein ABPG75_004005 [Micractinium tetrahymenae]